MSSYFDDKQLFLEPSVKQYGSHMVMSNVVKPTKTKYINIDTKYRDEPTLQAMNAHLNISNTIKRLASCTIQLPQRINDVKSITVRSAEIPMTMCNICETTGNHILKIKQVAGSDIYTQVITIPSGEYSATTLVTKLNSIFSALSAPLNDFSISFNSTTNRFEIGGNIANTNSFSVYFAVKPDGTPDYTNFKNKLGWILGYRLPEYTFNTANPTIAEDYHSLNPRYLYLAVDEFSKGNQNSFVTPVNNSLISKNVLAKIIYNKTTYPYGAILPANTFNGYLLSDKREYNGKVDLQKLLVQLVDDSGHIVNLNGIDFSFTLEVEYE